MAVYPKAVRKLIAPGSNDPRIHATEIIYHTAVMRGKSLHGYFAHRSGGIESHFYIRYDGTVEQYRDTDFEADANYKANPRAISIETEGMGHEPWTPEQVEALTDLTVWLCRTHKIPARKVRAWNKKGLGYHSQFRLWSPVVKSCPGPKRIKQVPGIIKAAHKRLNPRKPHVPYPGKRALRHGPAVTLLGRRLTRLGYGHFYAVGPGPNFGRADRMAVRRFQRDQGWQGTGNVGRKTWARLFK